MAGLNKVHHLAAVLAAVFIAWRAELLSADMVYVGPSGGMAASSDANLMGGLKRQMKEVMDEMAMKKEKMMDGTIDDPSAGSMMPCHLGGQLNCDPNLRRRFRWDDYVGTNNEQSSRDAPWDYCVIGRSGTGAHARRRSDILGATSS